MINFVVAPVSVVIPCYRCSTTIVRAINSICKQTVKPAEVILVDDASGDGTLETLQSLSTQYPGWIKVINFSKNQGAGSARNAGWKEAEQPYIAFLDSDDTWHSKKIEIQYSYMSEHSDVLLCGHEHRVVKQADSVSDWDLVEYNVENIRKTALLLSNRFITPSVMVRRDVKQRFMSGQRYMEDHMLWLEILCGGGKVTKLSIELAVIYKSSFGVSGLSAQLWLMEKNDLGNLVNLYHNRCINVTQLICLILYSLIKYFRRLLIYWSYLKWKK